MAERTRMWFVENDKVGAVFFCDTLGIYAVTPEEKIYMISWSDGMDFSDERVKNIIRTEQQKSENLKHKNCNAYPFYSLTLNISNTCNMQCAYCFANYGNYHSQDRIMSIEKACKAVDRCIDYYGSIGEIKFFGGEPMLAKESVEAVCRHVSALESKRIINSLPVFRIISNGTVMSPEIARMISDYHINYIVSLDGDEHSHNSCRRMKSGEDSYKKIIDNINMYRSITGCSPDGIEITYNGYHERNHVHIIDMIKHIASETGTDASAINLSPVMTENKSIRLETLDYVLEGYIDEINDEIRKSGIDYSDKKYRGLIRILKNRMRSGNRICEAGKGCIAVSADGNIYPCLMFVGDSEFCCGDLSNDLAYCEAVSEKRIGVYDVMDNDPCRSCPVNQVCRQCMGVNKFQTGSICKQYEPQCRALRKRIEKAILGIAEGLY